MPAGTTTCPECGEVLPSRSRRKHMTEVHGDIMEDHPTDEAPKPKRQHAPKSSAPKTGGMPLKLQITMLYRAVGTLTQSRTPITSAAIMQQAPQCAEAWTLFLNRYPEVRAFLEKGMIAGDIIGLLMAHMPIAQAFREELTAMRMQEEMYGDGVGNLAQTG